MRLDAAIGRLSELVCVAAGIKGNSGKPLTAAELTPWMGEERIATEDDLKRMFRISE